VTIASNPNYVKQPKELSPIFLVDVQKDIFGNVSCTTSQSYKLNNRDDNYGTICQIILFGDKILVTTRHMIAMAFIAGTPKEWEIIEQAVKKIIGISEHIIDYSYDKHTIGQIPQPWANSIMHLLLETKK